VLPLRARLLRVYLPQAAPTVNHMLSYGQAFDSLVLSYGQATPARSNTPDALSNSHDARSDLQSECLVMLHSDYKSERAGCGKIRASRVSCFTDK